jgi:hypothetical protein
MIIVPLKEGENIERALKKFKRKFEKTGVIRELTITSGFCEAFSAPQGRNQEGCIRSEDAGKRRIIRLIFF